MKKKKWFSCIAESYAYLNLWADMINQEILVVVGWNDQQTLEDADRDCPRWWVEGV